MAGVVVYNLLSFATSGIVQPAAHHGGPQGAVNRMWEALKVLVKDLEDKAQGSATSAPISS